MTNDELVTLIQGANVLACLAIAAFFLRWWRSTGDTFFLLFSLSFGMFAVNRLALAWFHESDEAVWLYVIRLATFLLIATAIITKNRSRPADAGRSRHR